MAPAAVSWAAAFGWLNLSTTPLAFLTSAYTPWVLSGLALGELVVDQLPSTPSRTVPMQFGARIVSGALSGGAIGASAGNLWLGVVAGVAGAVIGTLGGRALRGSLAARFKSDHPAAFIEDGLAIALAAVVIMAVRP